MHLIFAGSEHAARSGAREADACEQQSVGKGELGHGEGPLWRSAHLCYNYTECFRFHADISIYTHGMQNEIQLQLFL